MFKIFLNFFHSLKFSARKKEEGRTRRIKEEEEEKRRRNKKIKYIHIYTPELVVPDSNVSRFSAETQRCWVSRLKSSIVGFSTGNLAALGSPLENLGMLESGELR